MFSVIRGAVLADMADDPTTRRSLAHVVEGALYFFGVANVDQFEVLLDDADQRAILRAWHLGCGAHIARVMLLQV